jgi:hypothetical protein
MENTKILMFVLFFSVLFHFFAFGFTTFGADYDIQDVSLTREELWRAGIMIGDSDEHNLTFGNPMTTYTLNESVFRARFGVHYVGLTAYDGLRFQKRSDFLSGTIGIWQNSEVKGIENGIITNATIITAWNSEYNWSRFQLKTGYEVIIRDPDGLGNITDAVYNDSEILVILAENLDIQSGAGMRNFVRWYSGLILGTDDFGLPSFFGIIVKIMTIIGVVSVYLLLKDIIPFIG